jgi:hypothetical protein
MALGNRPFPGAAGAADVHLARLGSGRPEQPVAFVALAQHQPGGLGTPQICRFVAGGARVIGATRPR